MDIEKKREISKKLSRINLNGESKLIGLKTYWCRVAFGKFDKWNYKEHGHSFFEIQLCLEGEGVFFIDNEEVVIRKNDYIIVPPQKKHRIVSATADFEKFIWGFAIKDDDIGRLFSDKLKKISAAKANKCILDAINIILDNVDSFFMEGYNIIKLQLYCIFIYILRTFIGNKDDIMERSDKYSQNMENIKKFIIDNISEKMTVSDIANQFYLSERQVTRICLSESNMTPAQLKRHIQIEKIKELLSKKIYSMEDIADLTGFTDRAVMSKAFKRVEGMSPTEYRISLKC